ncbi:hypothetical protein R6Q57_027487 [Mikania cordata]
MKAHFSSLYSIAKKWPPNFTGADMYALCAVAWFHAAKQQVLAVDADPTNMKDEVDSVVEYEDFVTVNRERERDDEDDVGMDH